LAEPPPPSLDAAIAALWRDARPRALGRVATLEAAVTALRDGALAGDAAVEATREAHKLAGALGTFGMPAGTRHARTVEQRLAAGAAPEDAAALAGEVAALRAVVEAGPGA
jgi:HPt (histidine-containing phosphotransfer) domain-containing protein